MEYSQRHKTTTVTVAMLSYTLVEINEIGNLPPGTQIAVKGSYGNMHPSLAIYYPLFSSEEYYYHHGVYLGNCKVAHFSGENKMDAKPRECDIYKFWKGAEDGKLYHVKYNDTVETLPVQETLKRAREILNQPSKWPGFQLIKNNCESFATWLKTGIKRSAQATKAMIKIIPLVAGGAVVSSLAGISSGPASVVGVGLGVSYLAGKALE